MQRVVLFFKELGPKRLFFGVVTLLIIIGAIIVLLNREPEIDPKFQEAFNNSSYDVIIKGLEERIYSGEKDPTILKAVSAAYIQKALLGERKKARQSISVALSYLQSIVRFYKNDDEAYRLLGQAYLVLQDYQKAEENYKKAISINPRNAEAHAGLGIINENKGDTDAASRNYREAKRVDPNNETSVLGMARIKLSSNNSRETISLSSQLIQSGNKSIRQGAYMTLGSGYTLAKKPNQALEAYKEAAKLGSNDPHLYVLTAQAYINQYLSYVRVNNLEPMAKNALAETEKALKIDPTYIYAYTTQHRIYMMLKDKESAQRVGNKIISLLPKDKNLTAEQKKFYADYYKKVPTVTITDIKVGTTTVRSK
ncbi:MAG: tetratricopeptide repeat protein [Candidatus Taylorbacteria bacterium]|nr:tetratricopeptide repeat protein [Candidatus Taylorbacteria bacterium]